MVGASKRRQQAARGSQVTASSSHSTSAGEATPRVPFNGGGTIRPSPFDGNEEARPDQQLVLNKNIDASVTIWAHVSGANIAIQKRPAPSKLGREIVIGLNTFDVAAVPKVPVYQYDILMGSGESSKKALNKKLWNSKKLKAELPLPQRWIFDGEKIAYSTEKLEREIRCVVDLDEEQGRTAKPGGKPNTHRVAVKLATTVKFDNLRAYLDGKADFSTSCLESINFLDHLLREGPSQRLTSIKRNFFQSGQKDKRFNLGSGAEAFKGVYQSMRIAHSVTGKHNLTVNVDVANGTFWTPGPLSTTITQLLRCRDANEITLQRIASNEQTLKKIRRVRVYTQHRPGVKDEYTIERIVERAPGQIKISGTQHTIESYMLEKYNIRLKNKMWPAVKMTKPDTYLPLELVYVGENQRVMGKLDERQTSQMILFAVTPPQQRWQDIQNGLALLDWSNDKFLTGYGLKINSQSTTVKARLIEAPKVQFGTGEARPGTSGRWDLKGKKFLKPNTEPLKSWGVCIMPGRYVLDQGTVQRFMTNFMNAYKAHGGVIANNPLIVTPSNPDPGNAVQETYEKTQASFNAKPQILVFILTQKEMMTYGRIKKSCECRYGIVSQCMQSSNVQKGAPQYISNVLMKFNAKLGGTTARAIGAKSGGPNGFFSVPTMIVAADVTHPASRSQGSDDAACSIAAVTTSMDRIGARYNALVETNGYRVEGILPENWNKIWKPSVQSWMTNVGGGRLPQVIYYFRDGVSEGQFSMVLRQEVQDMKEVLKAIDPKNEVKFVVIIATKRHHLRFFPPSGGDRNGNALPGTLVETAITHPYENDFFLCSHSAIKGTARPTHYHVLVNEPNYPNELIQTLIYEHSYQYMRSTTPVSLFPAVYYADIAAERGRYHDRSFGGSSKPSGGDTRGRLEGGGGGGSDRGSQSPRRGESQSRQSSSSTPSHVAPLMPLPNEKIGTSMWFI